ncbi:hypothetical protein AAC387_Pa11g0031 [Persea americana]
MAEGVVTLFLNKLSELMERETRLLGGVSQDVRLLHEKFQGISLFLKEADDKCLQEKEVKLWVAQVRDTASEAEDIVENFVLKVELSRRRAGFVRLLKNPINRWIALHKTGKEIQNINLKIANISKNRSKLDLGNVHEQYGGEPSTSGMKEKRARRVEEVHIVGIEDEAEMVCKLLMEGDTQRSVVSIIGMGGLGKTTLAGKVFNDMRIRRHFECYAWIYASQEFKARDLLYDLIKCLKTPSSNDVDKLKSLSGEELREELSNYLERRRYLIVIDDIWNREDWDYIQASLPNKNNGSRIMLTTRHNDVALSSDPRCKPYWLQFLNHKDSQMLLLEKAFPEVVNHPHLEAWEQVEEDMVIRCYGLPIAVVVLGGLLSTKDRTIGEWKKVVKAIDLHQKEGQPTIFAILAVSYNDLPYYLKMCFLYFAAFPKGSNICPSNLFQMWVAEGFVQERGDETPEEIAEDYLLELIHRNLVQVAERHFDGRVKRCCIHDIVRDFAIEIAKEDQFLSVYCADVHTASPTPAHRLSIAHANSCKYVSMNHWTTHLRSLFCFIQYDPTLEKENWNSLFKRFKFLRVMHIDSLPNSMVPDGIGDLIYLRYFSVRFKGKKHMLTLPSTISNLRNLQTLIILGVHKLLSDDQGTWKIRQLRHLVTSYGLFSSKANHMNLNELTNLHTLSMMTVGHWISGEFDQLTSLRSLGLGGELNLYQTGLSSFIGKQANLKSLQLIQIRDDQLPIQIISSHLHHLEKLHLSGRLDKLPTLQEVAPCLTKLVLFNTRLVEDPMVVLEKLPKLELLRLKYGSYSGKKMSCSAKGFSKLAVLEINFLEELEDWTAEDGAIANLRHLEIRKCSKLKMIPEQFRRVATLQELPLLQAVDPCIS